MAGRRRNISGLPRPLPECSECKTPVRRPNWIRQKGKCSDCMTPAERMAAVHRDHQVAKLADGHTHRVSYEDRLARLAARVADRQARQAQAREDAP